MKTRRLIVAALLLAPVLLVLLWHLSNRGLPSDDAANHAMTAVGIAKQFGQNGVIAGLAAARGLRGWRPIAFPPLAVPFLLLTGIDTVAACGATLFLIYLAIVFYLYRLAHLCSGDPLVAAIACAAAVTLPTITCYSLIFFSESAFVLASVACAYYLLQSGPLRSIKHSIAAGICAGAMTTIRPVESVIVVGVLVTYVVFGELRAHRLTFKDCLVALGISSPVVLLVILSTWLKGIGTFSIWAVCAAAVAAGVHFSRRYSRPLLGFCCALVSVVSLWWAGYMPALRAWVQEATLYSNLAQVTVMNSASGIGRNLTRQVQEYGEVPVAFLAGMTIVAIASALAGRQTRVGSEKNRGAADPAWLLLRSSLTMLVIFAAIYSSTGSDRRRALAGVTLVIVSVLTTVGKRYRLALVLALCLIAAQITVLGRAVAGLPPAAALARFGPLQSPHRGPDLNFDTVRALSKYVPAGSSVAVYTLALFQADARIYEPSTLRLISLQGNYGLAIGYPWDIGGYDEVIARLRQQNYKYLFLDSYPQIAPSAQHEPYVHFAAELLRRMQTGDAPGLRVVAHIRLADRDQTLFRVLPEAALRTSSNLASEFNGATAVASEQQTGYPAANLNDGTEAAWGSQEGTSDVYAGVLLPEPHTATVVRLRLFTPNGRAHAHIVRIVAGDGDTPSGPQWHVIRSRIKGAREFALTTTIPLLPDNSWVSIELDRSDPLWKARRLWGIACLRSQGDLPNYLSVGTGFYLREIEVE